MHVNNYSTESLIEISSQFAISIKLKPDLRYVRRYVLIQNNYNLGDALEGDLDLEGDL